MLSEQPTAHLFLLIPHRLYANAFPQSSTPQPQYGNHPPDLLEIG
jgi:hypothetical protein